jgi:hypothetical protein
LRQNDYAACAGLTHLVLHERRALPNEPAYQILTQLETKVRQAVLTQCRELEQRGEVAELLALTQTLPKLGLLLKGLTWYCTGVAADLRKTLAELAAPRASPGLSVDPANEAATGDSVSVSNNSLSLADVVTRVLDAAAICIKKHARPVQLHFGQGLHHRLLALVQREVDSALAPVFARFVADQQLRNKAAKLRAFWTGGPKLAAEHRRDVPEASKTTLDAALAGNAPLATFPPAPLAPHELRQLLEEMAFATRECESFESNLRLLAERAQKALEEVEAPSEVGEKSAGDAAFASEQRRTQRLQAFQELKAEAGQPSFSSRSQLSECVQEIVGLYVTLEEFFILSNVRKAARIDDCPDPGLSAGGAREEGKGLQARAAPGQLPPVFAPELAGPLSQALTTTLVDDVFYILKQSCERAFATGHVTTACAVLNQVVALLGRDFMLVFDRLLQAYVQCVQAPSGTYANGGGIANIFGSSAGSALASQARLKQDVLFFRTLNNLTMCMEYAASLRQQLSKDFDDGFQGKVGHEMLSHGLRELEDVCKQFKKAAKRGLTLVVRMVSGNLRPYIDAFGQANYELSEAQYSERQLADPCAQSLLLAVQREVVVLQPCLSPGNWAVCVGVLVDLIVKRIETLVMAKQFSFWGGLQLDQDVRAISGYFGGVCSYSMREKFTRLVQIASILQLERVGEMVDYWAVAGGSGAGASASSASSSRTRSRAAWRLYEHEVRTVLALRADFSARDIQALQL